MSATGASKPVRWCLFASALGHCAIGWSERGLVRLWCAERDERRLRSRLERLWGRAGEAVPKGWLRELVGRVQRHVAGDPQSFSGVKVDLAELSPFAQQVLAVLRQVRAGATTSYGALACAVGSPGAARAVGRVMAHNPLPIVIPCHRVLAAGGKLGGFSAPGGVKTKQRLLALEAAAAARPWRVTDLGRSRPARRPGLPRRRSASGEASRRADAPRAD